MSWLLKWRQATKYQRLVMSAGQLNHVIEEAEEELHTLRQQVKAADRLRDAVEDVLNGWGPNDGIEQCLNDKLSSAASGERSAIGGENEQED